MSKKLVSQILKFGVVGGLAFLIDYAVLILCTDVIHIPMLISSAISFTVSVIFNYIASVKWVFDVDEEKDPKKNFILFIILSIIGLILTEIIMWLGVDLVHFDYKLVKIFATGVVMVFNFITRKIFLE